MRSELRNQQILKLQKTENNEEDPVAQWRKDVPRCEIIVGSELTYTNLSVETLGRVIEYFLAPNGVFYEVLSDDRDVKTLIFFRIAFSSV